MRSTAAIFGAPVTDPPGNVASRIPASPTPSRSKPCTVETMCSTPVSECVVISSGQVTVPASQMRERSFRSRSTIMTCSAASFGEARSSVAVAARSRALDGHRPDEVAAAGEEQLRRRRGHSPGVGDERRGLKRSQGREAGGKRTRIAGERCPQVLDEVDLIHVAAADRGPDLLDRPAVLGRRPRLCPVADLEARDGVTWLSSASRHAASGSTGQGSGGAAVGPLLIACDIP